MFGKVIILAAGFWTGVLAAQTAPLPATPRRPVGVTERALRGLLKSYGQQNEAPVCSIPLLEVRIAKDVEPMPRILPPAAPDDADNIDHMPMVKVPAPPCQEESH